MFTAARYQLAGVLVRRDARDWSTHLTRGISVILLWSGVWMLSNQTWRQAAGRDLLENLTWISGLLMVITALEAYSSLLTDNWTGPDLDLLWISGMSPFDLLIAKSLPHVLTALVLLLIEVPFALVTITMGGVTYIQLAALTVQLLMLFLWMSGCSMIWGVLSATAGIKPKAARVLALLSMGLLLLATPVADGLWDALRPQLGLGSDKSRINPVHEIERIFSSGFAGPVLGWTVALQSLVVVWLFHAAKRLLTWQLTSDSTDAEPAPVDVHAPPLSRPVDPPPRCTDRAIEWMEYYFTVGPEMLAGKWVLVAILSPVVALMAATIDRSDRGLLILAAAIGLVFSVGSIAFTASRLWQTELRERTLWGLAMLPLPAEAVIIAKLKTLAHVSLPEIVILTVATLLPLRHGQVTATAILGGVFASLPLIVCTDTGWRFIAPTWEGLAARAKLVGVVVATWSLAGLIGYFTHPLAGLMVLIACVPWAMWLAIDEAAKWFAWRAGEM